MHIANKENTEGQEAVPGVSIWWLISEKSGAPNFEMRYFEVRPGMSTPHHSHEWEHEVFVVAGSGLVHWGGRDHSVQPGDAIYIEPRAEHHLRNPGPETFGFICVVPKGTRTCAR